MDSCLLPLLPCRGRYCSWGFQDVENVTKAVVEAPGPGMYIAALRGYEGKPLPASLGGFQKRCASRGPAHASTHLAGRTTQVSAARVKACVTVTAVVYLL